MEKAERSDIPEIDKKKLVHSEIIFFNMFFYMILNWILVIFLFVSLDMIFRLYLHMILGNQTLKYGRYVFELVETSLRSFEIRDLFVVFHWVICELC